MFVVWVFSDRLLVCFQKTAQKQAKAKATAPAPAPAAGTAAAAKAAPDAAAGAALDAGAEKKRATQWEQTKAMSAANENFKAGKFQEAYEGYGAAVSPPCNRRPSAI